MWQPLVLPGFNIGFALKAWHGGERGCFIESIFLFLVLGPWLPSGMYSSSLFSLLPSDM